MKKTLFGALSVLAILVMVSPSAATVLFQEDFTGSTDDADLNGWNGWAANPNKFYTSSVLVDSGMSVKGAYGDPIGQTASHTFSNTPGAGETTYELSATFKAIGGFDTYLAVSVYDSEGSKELQVRLNSNEIGVWDSDGQTRYAVVDLSKAWDVKVVFTDTAWNGYYKENGTGTWTDLLDRSFSSPVSAYDNVLLRGTGMRLTRGDSILLVSVPEPVTVLTLALGLGAVTLVRARRRNS